MCFKDNLYKVMSLLMITIITKFSLLREINKIDKLAKI